MHSDYTIITNHQPRPLLTRWDVPQKILASDFDWLDPEESGSFFRYRGWWYELSDFVLPPKDLPEWHGFSPDSYFSGVLIRLSEDGEEIICGRYCH